MTSIRQGAHLVVYLDGDLDMASAPAVLAAIDQLLSDQVPGRVVIDLARVGFLDSSGLAVLADVLKTGTRLDFGVALVGAGARLRHLLEIVHMSDLFLTD